MRDVFQARLVLLLLVMSVSVRKGLGGPALGVSNARAARSSPASGIPPLAQR